DSDEIAALIAVLLEESGFSVHRTSTLAEGERAAGDGSYICAFVDLDLPDARGLQSVMGIRHASPELPLVVLSGQENETAPIKAVLLGAQEWVGKHEVSSGRLEQAAALAIARQDAQTALIWRAAHDEVTGLPNRALALEHLTRALGRVSRRPTHVAVLFCDLDGFKAVNDDHGHAAGDAVLGNVAHRMIATVRPGDVVARWGGDEFLVVAEGIDAPGQALIVADRLRAAVAEPIDVDGACHEIAVSVGVTVTSGTRTAHQLIAEADHAMLHAKRTGAGVHVVPDLPG
ncbi:MAG: response regulator, partial [Solirubrobacterales bacterium]|nr:response regulator [Solirubrobacterales bacterium]